VTWIDDHCTTNSCPAVISNGPFMLERFDIAAQFAELVAFRDPTYPFKPGDWYFGAPQLVSFTSIDAEPVVAGRPARVEVALEGPGELGVRYLLLDPVTKKSVAKGEAEPTGSGRFTIPLSAQETANLPPGFYVLFLAGFSDAVSAVTEQRVDLEVTAG
jgi:peptide/nickel transport system substrate-binding protein